MAISAQPPPRSEQQTTTIGFLNFSSLNLCLWFEIIVLMVISTEMTDYEFDGGLDYNDSDEDTEDASETESMKYDFFGYPSLDSNYEISRQIYRDKLSELNNQLIKLDNGTHPKYLNGLEQLEHDYNERDHFIHSCFELQKALIVTDFENEEKSANQEFEYRRNELKENLISELEEKRKQIETDVSDLLFDFADPKPLTTRKLRRRPNDPAPLPDRRRRASPSQINLLLEDSEINEDLKLISKSSSKNASGRNSSLKNYDSESHFTDVRIEDGKLFFDKKWFHRGQNIVLESYDGGKWNAMIVQIGTNEIFVRKSTETGKTRVLLSELYTKKYTIQRRS